MNLFLAFFCNVLVNSFLMFLTSCLLVEVLLFIFQIKNIRISLFARLIPMLKLVIDFSLYKYSSWALWNDINPFLAEKYSRSLDVGYFFDSGIFPWLLPTITLHIKKTLSFSVGDIFYLLLEPNFVFFLCMFVLSISVILLFKYLLGSRNTYREKREFFPKISNPSIKKKLLEFKVRFYITNGLHSPFVEGIRNPAIYFPKNAQTLYSSDELQAILAHELAHIVHKDLYLLSFLRVLSTLFWWIPQKWWLKTILEHQELLADEKTAKWAVKPIDLATAIHKSLKSSFQNKAYAFKSGSTKRRVIQLFVEQKKRPIVRSLVILYLLVGILIGNIWLF